MGNSELGEYIDNRSLRVDRKGIGGRTDAVTG